MFRPFSNVTGSADAVRRNLILLSKGVTMNLIIMRRIIGLAAVLGSTLMVACGLHCTNPSTETLTVYEDAPTL